MAKQAVIGELQKNALETIAAQVRGRLPAYDDARTVCRYVPTFQHWRIPKQLVWSRPYSTGLICWTSVYGLRAAEPAR